jgi:hypothetical protein
MSGKTNVVAVSPLRGPDNNSGAEALNSRVHHPHVNTQRRSPLIDCIFPGAVREGGFGDEQGQVEDDRTIKEQDTVATHKESTIHIVTRVVNTEDEENRRLREQDLIRYERDLLLFERDLLRLERDQLRQMVDIAVVVTPVVATDTNVENGDENIHANDGDLLESDDHKCGTKGRRWFAISVIFLVVVAVTVSLALVLPSEPTAPVPTSPVSTTHDPTTPVPTSPEPTTPEPTTPVPTTPESTLSPTLAPSPAPTLAPTLSLFVPSLAPTGGTDTTAPNLERLIDNFAEKNPGTEIVLSDTTSPQYRAMQWLAEDVEQNSFTLTEHEMRILQRGVLAILHYSTLGEEQWTNQTGWLNSTLSECEWFGTECLHGEGNVTVTSLALKGNELGGTIPLELSFMGTLKNVTLSNNLIGGTIPTSIGQLSLLSTSVLILCFFYL